MERLSRNYTTLSDEYEFSMSNAYYNLGIQNTTAVFDIFFRKVPNNGGYAIMAGLDKIIEYVNNLGFTEEDLS